MSPPLFTVLITTHNYGRFVEEAVDSVLSQEFPPDQVQVLVVDDGSTDDTAERVRRYGSRVEYVYKPNGGQASALNHGIARARGEVIALLDADDYFLPGKLARLAGVFSANPDMGMVYHKLEEWNVETGLRREWNFAAVSGDIRMRPEQMLSFLPQPTSAVAFRRDLLRPLLPIPERIRMLADCYLVALMPFLAPIQALPEVLTLYRIHGKNSYTNEKLKASREDGIRKLEMWRVVVGAMDEWLSRNRDLRKRAAARVFLGKWRLFLEGLQVDPPGRLLFFLALVRENYGYAPLQTWRLTAFNYLFAPLALVLGPDRASRFYRWRGVTMGGAEKAVGPILRASRGFR